MTHHCATLCNTVVSFKFKALTSMGGFLSFTVKVLPLMNRFICVGQGIDVNGTVSAFKVKVLTSMTRFPRSKPFIKVT